MNEPKFIINAFHHGALYEVSIKGTHITKILHYTSPSSEPSEVKWESLSEEVQTEIISKFKERQH